jgi:hypothetical protein
MICAAEPINAVQDSTRLPVRLVDLPALVNGKLPDVFDVLLNDEVAARVDRLSLATNLNSLKRATSVLSRMGYEVSQFRDERTNRTVWSFRKQNDRVTP